MAIINCMHMAITQCHEEQLSLNTIGAEAILSDEIQEYTVRAATCII